MFAFGDYDTTDLLWLGDWSTSWIALLVLIGLAVLAYSAFDLRNVARYRRWTLIGLRGLVYGLAVVLLLEPAIDMRDTSKIPNHVAVVVDQSMTMDLKVDGDGTTRMDRARQAITQLRSLQEDAGEDHHFDFFTYGEELAPASPASFAELEPRATAADLTGALEQVQEHYEGKDLGGVILISDGIDTGSIGLRKARGEEMDEFSRQFLDSLNAPVHTLAAAGEEGLRDLAISRVLHDDFAFVHNSITVDVELQAIGMEATSVPVTLRRDGRVLQTRNIHVHPDETSYEVTFEFVPEQIGKEVYTVQVPKYEGEALYENNEHHFVLPVIRDRIRVLQVVGRPSWDQRFLRRLLKRNPNVELISFFILRTDQNPQIVPQSEMSLIPFPTDKLFDTELGSFDLVVFQNFNFRPYRMGHYLRNIDDFVREGGAFAMVGGDLSFASGEYARTPIEDLLPVQLPSSRARSEIMDSEDFRPQLTDAGDRHPITQLAFDPQRNREIWEELPPLRGTNVVAGAAEEATVLAEHPTIRGNRGEPMPVIAVAERGEGRVMAVTSDSTWRWGFEHVGEGGTPREYQNFWNSAIRWLIQDPELKLVRLDTKYDIIAPDAPLDATVSVYTPDYSPAVGAEGELRIEHTPLDAVAGGTERGAAHYDTVEFSTDHSGQWDLDRRFSEPGIYEFEVEVESRAGTLTDDNLVLVAPDVSQYRDIVPRNRLLEIIAEVTDGHHALLPDFDADDLQFKPPRHVEIHNRQIVQLWDNIFLFLVILTLLGVEWSLRRRWGRL